MEVPTHIIKLKNDIVARCKTHTHLSIMGYHDISMHAIDSTGWAFEAKEYIEKRAKNRLGRYKDFKYDSDRMLRILDNLIDDFAEGHVKVFFICRDMFGGYDDLEEDLVYRCEGEKAEALHSMRFDHVVAFFEQRPLMTNIGCWQQTYGKIALIEVLCSELSKPMPKPIEQPKEKTGIPKIKFLGKQKQLAELFSVLIEKGWIDATDKASLYKAIESTFLYSGDKEVNSINQYLKPSTDTKNNSKDYEQIHTSDYTAMFHAIKKRT
jgi:hypothetical protein